MAGAEREMVMQCCIDRFGGDYEARDILTEAEIELDTNLILSHI